MTAFGQLSAQEQQALEEAARWRLRLARDPLLEASAEYRRWCSDRRNASARDAVGKAWASVGALEAAPEMFELRRQALARLRQTDRSRQLRGKVMAAAVAAVVVMGIGAVALYQYLCCGTDYKTDIGERRIVALPDGSRISMDSDTRVSVWYGKTVRSITLDRGRSRFDVAHDSSRPFTVTAGTETVVAVGTSFDVERLQSTVLITLLQGQVVIKGAEAATSKAVSGSAQAAIALKAGEQLVAPRNARPAIVAADLQVARAWEAGRLLFRDEPLGDAVARVNRYTAHPISIDPSITSIRFSGVFNAGDVSSFVSAVTSYFPVQASTTATNSIILQPRP